MAQALNKAQKKGTANATFSIENIKQEAFQLINTAERNDILPNDASSAVRSTLREARSDSRELLNDLNLDENIDEFFNELSVDLDQQGNLKITAEGADEILDTEEIKDYLAENTDLSEAEINGVIEKWDNKIESAVNSAEEYYAEVKETAVAATDEAADIAGKYSIIAFFIFLLGAGAAFAGGAVGSPYTTVKEEQIED